MEKLIGFVASNLVTNPDAVRVEKIKRHNLDVYKLYVDPSDMGRVIGRQGRVATAIRAVMHASASATQHRVALDIQEDHQEDRQEDDQEDRQEGDQEDRQEGDQEDRQEDDQEDR